MTRRSIVWRRRGGRRPYSATTQRSGLRARRGVVLVAVLALLTLGAALVAGAFAAARAEARATRSLRASAMAHASARRAIVGTLASWGAIEDSLNVGAFVVRAWRDTALAAIDSADVRVRVQRLSRDGWLVTSEASVPSARAPIARRRARVLLERAPTIDSTIVSRPRAITRWASGDLY